MEIYNGFVQDFNKRMPIDFFKVEESEERVDEGIRLLYFRTFLKAIDSNNNVRCEDFATIKSKSYTVSSDDIENDIEIKGENEVSYWVGYWDSMIWKASQRESNCIELLENKLLSEYFQHICYNKDNSITLDSFFDSKRPFGNKDITASIIYNARIDELDAMSKLKCYLPTNIKNYCLELFNQVKNNLLENKVYNYNYVYGIINLNDKNE